MKDFSHITPEDPQLTAYALGEITDPAEKSALEQAIAEKPQLAAAVEDIRSTASLLGDAFSEETDSATEGAYLAPRGRDACPQASASVKPTNGQVIPFIKNRWVELATVAACLAILAAILIPTISETRYLVSHASIDEKYLEEKVNKPQKEQPTSSQSHTLSRQPAPVLEVDTVASGIKARDSGLTVQRLDGPGEAASAGKSAVVAMRVGEELVPIEQTAPKPDGKSVRRSNDFTFKSGRNDQLGLASRDTRKELLHEVERNWQRPAEPTTRPADEKAKNESIASQQTISSSLIKPKSSAVLWQSTPPMRRVDAFAPPSIPEPPIAAPQPDYRVQRERSNTEGYLPTTDNAFQSPLVEPLSTFSIDVDTASYANVRRFIEQGQLPPPDAVRIEELVNTFPYDYPAPGTEAEHPLAVYLDAAPAPWAPEHRLVRIGMKAKDIAWEERPASNLIFLIDVSGSMNQPNKLPLVKDALAKLIRRLDGRDRVAIVVYAGASGLVLPSTTANNQETISHALSNLKAGGSTNGGQGLALAYKVAKDNLLADGNNRIILCTDGDFNVGVSDKGEIADMAAEHAKDGINLTVLGFGMGNYKDDMLETLSNRGNGNYAYIDSEREARKVFVEQAAGTLLTVAKDVKIQVEFNPAAVKAYRLIGYENRILAARDFNDDTKDAGEVGAGHTVTALYEVVPMGNDMDKQLADIDPLKYQAGETYIALGDIEWLTVKLRYKLPESDTSTKLEFPLNREQVGQGFAQATTDFRFAAAVAAFGMVLRDSPYKGTSTLIEARNIAEASLGSDPGGHRGDFVELLEKAITLEAGQ